MNDDIERSRRGFASMDAIRRQAVASKGGKAAHVSGTAHEWNYQEAKAAGRKGGRTRAALLERLINKEAWHEMTDLSF